MVITGAEDEEYRLTIDDVDSSLVFMYTPVTEEGAKGEPQYKHTDFVKAGVWGSTSSFLFLFSFGKVYLVQIVCTYVDVLAFLCQYAVAIVSNLHLGFQLALLTFISLMFDSLIINFSPKVHSNTY